MISIFQYLWNQGSTQFQYIDQCLGTFLSRILQVHERLGNPGEVVFQFIVGGGNIPLAAMI